MYATHHLPLRCSERFLLHSKTEERKRIVLNKERHAENPGVGSVQNTVVRSDSPRVRDRISVDSAGNPPGALHVPTPPPSRDVEVRREVVAAADSVLEHVSEIAAHVVEDDPKIQSGNSVGLGRQVRPCGKLTPDVDVVRSPTGLGASNRPPRLCLQEDPRFGGSPCSSPDRAAQQPGRGQEHHEAPVAGAARFRSHTLTESMDRTKPLAESQPGVRLKNVAGALDRVGRRREPT